jgi:hypothetical protein
MTYCNLSKRLVLLAVLFLTFAWGPASEYYTVDLSSYFNNDGI